MYEAECAVIHDLSTSVEYQIIVATRGILFLVPVFRIISQWKEFGFRFLVHDNTKILFCFYYALSIFHSFVFGIVYLLELVRIRYECLLIDFRYLLLTKCSGISSVFSAHHVILIISFERLYSSIFPAHFERNSSRSLAIYLALTAV
ncbi:hypothetical protein PMAYCL1PPCAC_21854, partial [Pristionchus mayeri]